MWLILFARISFVIVFSSWNWSIFCFYSAAWPFALILHIRKFASAQTVVHFSVYWRIISGWALQVYHYAIEMTVLIPFSSMALVFDIWKFTSHFIENLLRFLLKYLCPYARLRFVGAYFCYHKTVIYLLKYWNCQKTISCVQNEGIHRSLLCSIEWKTTQWIEIHSVWQ